MTAMKRILLILLTLAMLMSLVPTAFAAEGAVTEADTYVLQRKGSGPYPDYTYYGVNFQYQSPYETYFTYEGINYSKSTLRQPGLFTMMNDATGNVIPTYCLDVLTTAVGGTWYRRQNLEDSDYSSSVAGRIRAIVLNGFYIDPNDYSSDEAHQQAVDANVARLASASNVENLTLGEAISATQLAIWQAAHGAVLDFDPFAKDPACKLGSAVAYAALCNRELADWEQGKYSGEFLVPDIDALNARIQTVYNYLLSLSPVAATSRTVAPSSFTDLNDPVITEKEDGTYNVSVTTTVSVDMASGDTLTLKAKLGSYTVSESLQSGSQTKTLTFNDIPAELVDQEVMLSISGYQTASGIFLFDASGERGASQTMVGMDSSRLPVYAEVVAQEERVISITKTTTSGVALEGIIFDIYPKASLEDYLSGKFSIDNPTSTTDLADYTLITNASGKASLNLTHHGLADGVYLVVERQHPAIVKPIDPFYLIVPMTNKDGTGYDYEIKLYPKNEVKGGVKIEKDVLKLNNNEASVDAYSDHTWILSASIPDDIAQGKSYVISDTLDNRLDYAGNVVVTVETTDGETVAATLEANTDYTLTVTNVNSLEGEKPSEAFTLALTDNGRSAVAAAVGTNGFSNYRLRVYFDARINANAQMGEQIPNQSSLAYVNSVNFGFNAVSDIPVVYTGGANLLKVDSENNATVLPGATFEVYRSATQDELSANVAGLVTLKGVAGKVLRVSFFNNAGLTGDKVTSVTSDKDGKIAIYGLAYGTYYLVETQAPAGYNLLGEPMELTVNAASHLEQNVLTVENVSGTVLPETGGVGTQGYVFTGMALMALSLLLILSKKRRIQA